MYRPRRGGLSLEDARRLAAAAAVRRSGGGAAGPKNGKYHLHYSGGPSTNRAKPAFFHFRVSKKDAEES